MIKIYEHYIKPECNPNSFFHSLEIGEEIGLAVNPYKNASNIVEQQNLLHSIIAELDEEDLIEIRGANLGDIMTTQFGREEAERLISGLEESPLLSITQDHSITHNTINNHGTISGSNLQQGSRSSTQSINTQDDLLQGISIFLEEFNKKHHLLESKYPPTEWVVLVLPLKGDEYTLPPKEARELSILLIF